MGFIFHVYCVWDFEAVFQRDILNIALKLYNFLSLAIIEYGMGSD